MFDGYVPYFELGVVEEDPAVRVLEDISICPTTLAALITALFETVMRTVPDEKQIEYEKRFNESLKTLMQMRFDYDVTTKYPDDE